MSKFSPGFLTAEHLVNQAIRYDIADDEYICDSPATLRGAIAAELATVKAQRDELLEVAKELVELIEAIREGEYTPDSFTTQPAQRLIAKAKGD